MYERNREEKNKRINLGKNACHGIQTDLDLIRARGGGARGKRKGW